MAGVMAAMDSIASKFAEYEYTIKLLTAKLEELAAENERLKANAGAHGTLKLIYSDDNQPAGLRVKAAQAALNVETPKLNPVPPPLDLVAEPVIPLAELIAQRRARQDRLEREGHDIEVSPTGVVRILPKPGSNGGDNSDDQ